MPRFDDGKTVQIPVRVVDGKLTFFYSGQELPLRAGVLGDLVIAEYAVGSRLRSLLQREQVVEMFPAHTTLWVNVRPQHMADAAPAMQGVLQRHPRVVPPADGWFAPIWLQTPLQLRLRGTKQAELLPCAVGIPGLQSSQRDTPPAAQSINQAYARISTACEPQRVSHTGNVFDKVYYVADDGWLHPIDDRRQALQATAERDLFILSQGWWLEDAYGLPRRWAHLGQDEHQGWVLSILDAGGVVHSQIYFEHEAAAHSRLQQEGYKLLPLEPEHVDDWPPSPPYRLPNGQETALPWRGATDLSAVNPRN